MTTLIAWTIEMTAPMECFRARLTKEALDKHWTMVSFMRFEGTDECKREESQHENRTD